MCMLRITVVNDTPTVIITIFMERGCNIGDLGGEARSKITAEYQDVTK